MFVLYLELPFTFFKTLKKQQSNSCLQKFFRKDYLVDAIDTNKTSKTWYLLSTPKINSCSCARIHLFFIRYWQKICDFDTMLLKKWVFGGIFFSCVPLLYTVLVRGAIISSQKWMRINLHWAHDEWVLCFGADHFNI